MKTGNSIVWIVAVMCLLIGNVWAQEAPVLVDSARDAFIAERTQVRTNDLTVHLAYQQRVNVGDGPFYIASGSPGGNYTKSAQLVYRQAKSIIGTNTVVVTSPGSQKNCEWVWELGLVHAALMQGDVMAACDADGQKALYQEGFVALVHRTSEIKNLKDLHRGKGKDEKVRVGVPPMGSGAWWSWENFAKTHKRYTENVVVYPENLATLLSQLESGELDLVFLVTGIRSESLEVAANMNAFRVIPTFDKAVVKEVQHRNKPVYTELTLSASANSAIEGLFVKQQSLKDFQKGKDPKSIDDVQVLSVGAYVVFNPNWMEAHSSQGVNLLSALSVAAEQMKEAVGQ